MPEQYDLEGSQSFFKSIDLEKLSSEELGEACSVIRQELLAAGVQALEVRPLFSRPCAYPLPCGLVELHFPESAPHHLLLMRSQGLLGGRFYAQKILGPRTGDFSPPEAALDPGRDFVPTTFSSPLHLLGNPGAMKNLVIRARSGLLLTGQIPSPGPDNITPLRTPPRTP